MSRFNLILAALVLAPSACAHPGPGVPYESRGNVLVADTTVYTVVIGGHEKGEWRLWQEEPHTWRYEYEGDPETSYHFPRTERLVLDGDGFPLVLEIDGQRSFWDRWVERYERSGDHARWTAHARNRLSPEWNRTLDVGEAAVSGPVYYAAVHPVHDEGVLARLLLQQPDSTLPLLPDGTARLEALGERLVDVDGRRRRIDHYAVHGLDLRPRYVWLDENGTTFANEWSVLEGWEEVFSELRDASEQALAEYHQRLAESLVPPVQQRPLVIQSRGHASSTRRRGRSSPGRPSLLRATASRPSGRMAALICRRMRRRWMPQERRCCLACGTCTRITGSRRRTSS